MLCSSRIATRFATTRCTRSTDRTTVAPCTRTFHRGSPLLAGQNYREKKGLSKEGNRDGPLFEMPDWEFADGTPAPLPKLKKKYNRAKEREVERKVRLWMEMKEDIKAGRIQQFF